MQKLVIAGNNKTGTKQAETVILYTKIQWDSPMYFGNDLFHNQWVIYVSQSELGRDGNGPRSIRPILLRRWIQLATYLLLLHLPNWTLHSVNSCQPNSECIPTYITLMVFEIPSYLPVSSKVRHVTDKWGNFTRLWDG